VEREPHLGGREPVSVSRRHSGGRHPPRDKPKQAKRVVIGCGRIYSCRPCCSAPRRSMWGQPAFANENWGRHLEAETPKSRPSARRPLPVPRRLKFEATARGSKLTSEGTDPQGNPCKASTPRSSTARTSSGPANPSADMACPKRIDDNSYENVWKNGGKSTMTARVVVSNHNKTLTVTQTPTDAQGAAAGSVAGVRPAVGAQSTDSRPSRDNPVGDVAGGSGFGDGKRGRGVPRERPEHAWAIVLAAGDGLRLSEWTADRSGRAVPKAVLLVRAAEIHAPLGARPRVQRRSKEHVLTWWRSNIGVVSGSGALGLSRRQRPRAAAEPGDRRRTPAALVGPCACTATQRPASLVLAFRHYVQDERTLRREPGSGAQCPGARAAACCCWNDAEGSRSRLRWIVPRPELPWNPPRRATLPRSLASKGPGGSGSAEPL